MIYYPVPSQTSWSGANRTQKFTGLSNQGATCYMNSLLQSLFMTPELRRSIYHWVYDEVKHGDKKDNIPYNLQLLFGKLQLSKVPYVETKALTTSFGWDLRDGFQQHDVQEFCRVLFDAIEESVRETPDEKMIAELYEGVMVDYVKCLACGYESSRQDKFLDLSLTVRNEFDRVYNDSVEKAIGNYIKPEKLCGDNQYFCEQCNSKQDARKGLKFEKFPKLLVLQLKRFDLDYTTFQRVKLNDRVSFPLVLNMNPFLKDYQTSEEVEKAIALPTIPEVETTSQRPVFSEVPADVDSRTLEQKIVTGYETILDDRDKFPVTMDAVAKERIILRETEERKAQQEAQIQEYMQEGEFVYELFSIMIHSGSAIGGHYYAYIKNFDDNRWYKFNDSTVSLIEESEIQKVFGGAQSTLGWGYSTNAYLLMYRKVEPTNLLKVDDAEVPAYIQDALEAILEQERLEAQQKAELSKRMSLKLNYNKVEKIVTVQREDLLSAVKAEALREFELSDLKLENVRLRAYSPHTDTLQEVYAEDKTLDALGFWNLKILALEVKPDGTEWPAYNPNGITVKVNLWNDSLLDDPRPLDTKASSPDKVVVDKKEPVSAMLQQFEELYGIPVEKQLVWRKSYATMTVSCELVNTQQALNTSVFYAKVYEGSLLYLEAATDVPSKWKELFAQEARRFTVKFNDPDRPLNSYNQPEYTCAVAIDCDLTVKDLRTAIAQALGLAEDEFIMRKGGKQHPELKDPSLKLLQTGFMAVSLVYIERGTPAGAGQFRIVLSLAKTAAQPEGDATCFTFFPLFDTAVSGSSLVEEFKTNLITQVVQRFPTVDLAKVRLRERGAERLLRVLQDENALNKYSLYDRKELVLQLLEEEPPALSPQHMVVVVKRWWPSTWVLSSPQEVIIDKTGTVAEFGERVAKAFGMDAETLEVAKMVYTHNFSRIDLQSDVKFIATKDNANEVVKAPWYLTLDGNFFFVKDGAEAARELTAEEKEKYKKATYYSDYSGYAYSYKPPVEKAVKITVKKKAQADVEDEVEKSEPGETSEETQQG